MQTVSDMTADEIAQAEESPRRIQFRRLAGGRRSIALLEAYLIADELAEKPKELHDQIIEDWAMDVNRSPGALWKEVGWAKAIKEDDLKGIFKAHFIPEKDWTQAVGTSHLQVIGKTKEQSTDRRLTSQERAELVFDCYHANWSVEELKTELRARDLLAPARGAKTKPTSTTAPTTAGALLIALGQHLIDAEQDIDLGIGPDGWANPVSVWRILGKLADRFEQERPFTKYKPSGAQGVPHDTV